MRSELKTRFVGGLVILAFASLVVVSTLLIHDVRVALPQTTHVLASMAYLVPLCLQTLFLLALSVGEGRHIRSYPMGIKDGWFLILTLSTVQAALSKELLADVSPALPFTSAGPYLMSRLGFALLIVRGYQYFVARNTTVTERPGSQDLSPGEGPF